MRKSKKIELNYEETERVISMAQEEKKPFEVIKEEFGLTENEVTEIMRKKLSKDNFELWKKKAAAGKDGKTLYAIYATEDNEKTPTTVTWTTNIPKGKMTLLNNGKKVKYAVKGNQVTVQIPAGTKAEPLAFKF
jgi:uncharacterized protein (TIGR03643 family)